MTQIGWAVHGVAAIATGRFIPAMQGAAAARLELAEQFLDVVPSRGPGRWQTTDERLRRHGCASLAGAAAIPAR